MGKSEFNLSRAVAPNTRQDVVGFVLIRVVSIGAHFLTKLNFTGREFF